MQLNICLQQSIETTKWVTLKNKYVEIDFDNHNDEFVDDLMTFVNVFFPNKYDDANDRYAFYYDREREILKIKIETIETIELFYPMKTIDRFLKMIHAIENKCYDMKIDANDIYYVKRSRHLNANTKRHLYIVDESFIARYDENDESIAIIEFDNESQMNIIISMY